MKILVMGLPGAGKTTLVKASKLHEMHLDLGHNAFKTDAEREKFYSKLVRFTTSLVSLQAEFILDTYPEYFDLDAVADSDCIVWFLLPDSLDEAKDLVARVGERDGWTSDFYKLYAKQYVKWYTDWKHTFSLWQKRLKDRVVNLGVHVNEVTVTTTGGVKHVTYPQK